MNILCYDGSPSKKAYTFYTDCICVKLKFFFHLDQKDNLSTILQWI